MKKTSIRTLAVLFSLAAVGLYGVIYACADMYWGYDYDSSFTPEVYVDKSYAPLFFAPNDVFYDIMFEDKYATRFNDAVVSDWTTHLKGKVPDLQVSALLLNDAKETGFGELYTAMANKQPLPAKYASWNVQDEKVRGFIEFLHYAKIIELSSTTSIDSWNYDEKKAPPVDIKIVVEMEKRYHETKDPFLKNRYWFQTMKGFFYGPNKQLTITFFEQTKSAVPQNTLYYRGLSYVAGAHYSKKNYATSNYLYSVVFDKCPDLRTVMAYDFHPQDQGDFQASLALAKTPDEKAALWALIGFYADAQTAIREIYKLNPASPHLDYLLTRLVNKEEAKLNANTFASAAEYRQAMKTQSDKDALQLVSTIAKEEKTSKPYLWNLAAGYLNIFAGNYTVADQLFGKAEKSSPRSPLAMQQFRLLKLLNTLSSIDRMDSKAESGLLADLNWLYNTKTETEDFRYHHALGWSKQYISALYKSQQNTVLAEMFNPDEKFYRTGANLEAMKAFLQKSVKTPWEQLASGIYAITLSDIFEYQSVTSAYAGKMDAAIAFMEQSEKGKDVKLLGNPFNGKIKDCHDCDHAATQKVTYSKLSFLKKVKEMLTYIEMGQDVYNNSMLVANAYYSMSYYGNARVFYYGSIINQYGNSIDSYYQPQLLSCDLARQYYTKALAAATTPEQKAKCHYLLAKCERNDFYTAQYRDGDYSLDGVDFKAWDGFKKLRSDYAQTNYYKDVIKECGYFAQYVGM